MRTQTAFEHWFTGVALPAMVGALVCGSGISAFAQTTQELKRLTLEQLTRMEISTVSRAPEPASQVPAAVFVITAEDIRRSGLTTLPELLRLGAGAEVLAPADLRARVVETVEALASIYRR